MPLIPDQLRWLASTHPEATAFEVVGEGSLTAPVWLAESARLARGMQARGVAPGDRVVLTLLPEDGLAFAKAYIAVHLAGGVAVPLNVRLTAPEVARLVGHAEARVAVASSSLVDLLPPGLEVLDAGRSWESWLDDDASDFQVHREETDLADILYTSGTTGTPKGVAIEHGNSALVTYAEPNWTGKPYLHASPMSTFAGLTFLLMPVRMGMQTLYQPRFDADQWVTLVEQRRPRMVFLVPAMVELLLDLPDLAARDLSSLRAVSVGSAPIAPATLNRFASLVPKASVMNSYSMTEAGTTYCYLPPGELAHRPGSVGQPLPPAEIRIVDDAGDQAAPRAVGDVVIKPAGRPRTYYRDTEATAALYDGEWLRTGDLGFFDEDGYLYITGRAKDVIIRGGNNIHASDVEAVLYEHDAVREAAVVGIPHPVLGEDVAAFVVLHSGASATPAELESFCRERLAGYKVPRLIEVRDSLPRNATGKVVKRELAPSAAPS